MPKIKNTILEPVSPTTVNSLIPGGQGIATLTDGQKAFFWNALPGEQVMEYKITKQKSHYIQAIATKIAQPSSHRIEPKDSCYLSTSPWQIMDYDYELTTKRELLIEQFNQAKLKFSPDSVQPVATDHRDFHYRNKMEYSLFWDHETAQIKLSFHQRGSHHKIPIESSHLEHSTIFSAAQEIIAELNAKHEEARKYQSLLLRADQNGQVSGGLFENHQPHPTFDNLTDTILGHAYSYSPNGFFQINLPVYEMALRAIQPHIQTDNVLDLYAGVGTIGLSVARDKNLALVESNPAAYQELAKNCQGTTAQAILSSSEEALEYIQPNQTVILDPPRAGCDQKLIDKLLEIQPTSIIYLSCNPATQARDLALLTQTYRIASIQPFNFFPRTPHLENLVVLTK